jgi:hypothetical protein
MSLDTRESGCVVTQHARKAATLQRCNAAKPSTKVNMWQCKANKAHNKHSTQHTQHTTRHSEQHKSTQDSEHTRQHSSARHLDQSRRANPRSRAQILHQHCAIGHLRARHTRGTHVLDGVCDGKHAIVGKLEKR